LVTAQLTANSVDYIGLLDESVVLEADELGDYNIKAVCEVVRSREIDFVYQLSLDCVFNVELHKALALLNSKKV
jgi:hypothetical protein